MTYGEYDRRPPAVTRYGLTNRPPHPGRVKNQRLQHKGNPQIWVGLGKEGVPETVLPKISQETLAEIGRDHSFAGEFFHEPVQEIGIHSLQWRVASQQLTSQRRSPRLASAPMSKSGICWI
jgi:hypothetical protein